MLTTLYRRLRNLDKVAALIHQLANLTGQLTTQRAAIEHQFQRNNALARHNLEQMRTNALQAQMIVSLQSQLEVNRALLAVTMRERDEAAETAKRHGRVLATMRQHRQREVANLRSWMTRVSAYHISSN